MVKLHTETTPSMPSPTALFYAHHDEYQGMTPHEVIDELKDAIGGMTLREACTVCASVRDMASGKQYSDGTYNLSVQSEGGHMSRMNFEAPFPGEDKQHSPFAPPAPTDIEAWREPVEAQASDGTGTVLHIDERTGREIIQTGLAGSNLPNAGFAPVKIAEVIIPYDQ